MDQYHVLVVLGDVAVFLADGGGNDFEVAMVNGFKELLHYPLATLGRHELGIFSINEDDVPVDGVLGFNLHICVQFRVSIPGNYNIFVFSLQQRHAVSCGPSRRCGSPYL